VAVVVVLGPRVVVVGPCVVLVFGAIVVSTAVVWVTEGTAIVVAEAGGLVPVGRLAALGCVEVTTELDGGGPDGRGEVVVPIKRTVATVVVVAGSAVLVVVRSSAAPATATCLRGAPRTISSPNALRENTTSA
jgi:hypothetical protein